MSESVNQMEELNERLKLIESMMAEGRCKTESWGWSFVLWGVAYYVAIAWATLGHANIAWPVTMIAAALLTALVGRRVSVAGPETAAGRAIGAVWIAVGVSLFVFCFTGSMTGHREVNAFLAVIECMLGLANAASGMILRWRLQFAVGVVWWGAAVGTFLVTESQASWIFLAAIFVCQIVFGTIMAVSEMRTRRLRAVRSGSAHA